MASQVGHLGGLPADSGAPTALSGANASSQDDSVAVDSPWATDSQASVALAGETNLPHAANSTAHTSAQLVANDSALSVTGNTGTVQYDACDLCLHAEMAALQSSCLCRQKKESRRWSASQAFVIAQ